MNKLAIRLTVSLSLPLFAWGCTFSRNNVVSVARGSESDATVRKEIRIGDFDKVSASQGIRVVFEQGYNTGVASVATTPEAEKYLQAYVKDGCLVVRYDNESARFDKKVKGPTIIRVASPSLAEIDLSSAAEFTIEGGFASSGSLDLDMSSGSDFSAADMACGNLDLDLSSGASFSVTSFTGRLSLDCSSGSDVNIGNVDASYIDAEASSGASITLKGVVAAKARAKASSGGTVSIYGNVDDISRSSSSGGTVIYVAQ